MATLVRSVGGLTFRGGPRLFAHLDRTIAKLKERHPDARLRIFQGAYNTGVAASAGTHDFDNVIDLQIVGLTWAEAQAFMRWTGWACWHRTPAQGFSHHLHAISLPPGIPDNPTLAQIQAAFKAAGERVGEFVPGQVDDYYAHAYGLKGQHRAGSDPSPFPPNINATVFKLTAPTPKPVAPVKLPTIADCLATLKRLALKSDNPSAAKYYTTAIKALGVILANDDRQKTPTTVAEVIAALTQHRENATSIKVKTFLTIALTALRPIK